MVSVLNFDSDDLSSNLAGNLIILYERTKNEDGAISKLGIHFFRCVKKAETTLQTRFLYYKEIYISF